MLTEINGGMFSFGDPPGFRNYVAINFREKRLTGFVQRIPTTRGRVVVKGTPEQLEAAVGFLSQMVSNGWVGELIESMTVRQAPVRVDFVILKSTSKHVVTGEHSDVKLEERSKK